MKIKQRLSQSLTDKDVKIIDPAALNAHMKGHTGRVVSGPHETKLFRILVNDSQYCGVIYCTRKEIEVVYDED